MLAIIQTYSEFKQGLGELYGLTEELLHVHAGLLIFVAAALLFRRRMRSRVPIALVYFFALANEVVDLMTPGAPSNPWEPLVDVLNTVFWPSLLFLLAQRRARRDDPDKVA